MLTENMIYPKLFCYRHVQIAHSFLLGTKYSSAFRLTYKDSDGNNRLPSYVHCIQLYIAKLITSRQYWLFYIASWLLQIYHPLVELSPFKGSYLSLLSKYLIIHRMYSVTLLPMQAGGDGLLWCWSVSTAGSCSGGGLWERWWRETHLASSHCTFPRLCTSIRSCALGTLCTSRFSSRLILVMYPLYLTFLFKTNISMLITSSLLDESFHMMKISKHINFASNFV